MILFYVGGPPLLKRSAPQAGRNRQLRKKDIVAVAVGVVYMKYTKTTGHPCGFYFSQVTAISAVSI